MRGPPAEAPAVGSSAERVARLAARAREVLAAHVPAGRPWALVDVPNHGNVGDTAIWLGELTALRDLGMGRPSYVCDLDTFSAAALRERIGGGPVLIHGGGNLGDLWPRHQRLREDVVRALPRNPVVQLPQSMEFRDPAALAAARAAFAGHPDFTLLLRDRRSLERASAAFDGPVALCPDLAFCLDPGPRPRPDTAVRWLLRTDHEGVPGRAGAAAGAAVDWLEEPRTGWVAAARGLAPSARLEALPAAVLQPVRRAVWTGAARRRLRRGLALLGSGSVVVTDRLHAHVLCLLRGIPHVLLPDRYGKIESFVATWTAGWDGVVVADDVAAADAAARRLVRASAGGALP